MSGVLERTLGIIELLAHHAQGLSLGAISQALELPRSATHRLLTELVETQYVRQKGELGDYMLTAKIMALGLRFLSQTGIVELTKPALEKLAQTCGELVRLGVIDHENIIWIGKAQGAKNGVRYDPDMGKEAKLSCTSTGHAWLMTLKDADIIRLINKQGIGSREEFGINAPQTMQEVMLFVQKARALGAAITVETHTQGIATIAMPILDDEKTAIGVLSVSAPYFRFGENEMHSILPELKLAVEEISEAQHAFPAYKGASL